jgi:hypothetical protein
MRIWEVVASRMVKYTSRADGTRRQRNAPYTRRSDNRGCGTGPPHRCRANARIGVPGGGWVVLQATGPLSRGCVIAQTAAQPRIDGNVMSLAGQEPTPKNPKRTSRRPVERESASAHGRQTSSRAMRCFRLESDRLRLPKIAPRRRNLFGTRWLPNKGVQTGPHTFAKRKPNQQMFSVSS